MKTLKKNFGEPLPTALWLHGGPGAGCYPNHARFFDPEKWRIVLLDQRGCGKSKYTGECWDSNDTPRLVNDLELLRTHLNLTTWDCVQGGSWGSTLALAYAQSHPSSVRSIVLRGVCLMRPLEIDWLFSPNGGAASLAPKGYAAFRKHVSLEEGCDDRDVLHAYYAADEPYEGHACYYDHLCELYRHKREILATGLRRCGMQPLRGNGGFFLMAETSRLTVPEEYLRQTTAAAPEMTRDWCALPRHRPARFGPFRRRRRHPSPSPRQGVVPMARVRGGRDRDSMRTVLLVCAQASCREPRALRLLQERRNAH